METPTSEAPQPTATSANCTRCRASVTGSYYVRGGQEVLCGQCREQVLAPPRLSGINAFFRASIAAGTVAVVASVISGLVTYATDTTFAIVWIFVSLGIGIAIKWASEDRGTWPFRLLGVFATYCAIGLSYAVILISYSVWGGGTGKAVGGPISDFIPTKQILQSSPSPAPTPAASPLAASPSASPTPGQKIDKPGESQNTPDPADDSKLAQALKGHPIIAVLLAILLLMVGAVAFVLVMPVVMMVQSPMEIVIDGIALYYAWKSTAPESKQIEGPFSLGDAQVP